MITLSNDNSSPKHRFSQLACRVNTIYLRAYCLLIICRPCLFCEPVNTPAEQGYNKVNGATQLVHYNYDHHGSPFPQRSPPSRRFAISQRCKYVSQSSPKLICMDELQIYCTDTLPLWPDPLTAAIPFKWIYFALKFCYFKCWYEKASRAVVMVLVCWITKCLRPWFTSCWFLLTITTIFFP